MDNIKSFKNYLTCRNVHHPGKFISVLKFPNWTDELGYESDDWDLPNILKMCGLVWNIEKRSKTIMTTFVFQFSFYFFYCVEIEMKSIGKKAASIDGTVALPNLTLSHKTFSHYKYKHFFFC